jgi:uncharacterized membrane protein (UPF0127 family)
MSLYRLIHLPSGQAVATVAQAESWSAKGWGVLGRRTLPAGEGLWLPGVASVHTLGVRFPLDLLFLNEKFEAVKIARETPPGRWLVRAPGACHTVELGAGTLTPLLNAQDSWRLERLAEERCFLKRKEGK